MGSGVRCSCVRSSSSRDRDRTRVGLGVDATSPTGANQLYESVGMREYARFAILEKDAE